MHLQNLKSEEIPIQARIIAIANVALDFYSLLAIRTYHAEPVQIAIFTRIAVIINIISSGVFGKMTDKYGHKHVLLSAAIFGVLAAFVVLMIYNYITDNHILIWRESVC